MDIPGSVMPDEAADVQLSQTIHSPTFALAKILGSVCAVLNPRMFLHALSHLSVTISMSMTSHIYIYISNVTTEYTLLCIWIFKFSYIWERNHRRIVPREHVQSFAQSSMPAGVICHKGRGAPSG